MNAKCKEYQRAHSFEKYKAIKELIDKGELTSEALKHNRHHIAETRAEEKEKPKEELPGNKRCQSTNRMSCSWSPQDYQKLKELVKKHGRQYKLIESAFNGKFTYLNIVAKLASTKAKMKNKPQFKDQEFFDRLCNSKYDMLGNPINLTNPPRKKKKTLSLKKKKIPETKLDEDTLNENEDSKVSLK